MSLWGHYRSLYEYWTRIKTYHSEMKDEWEKAQEFIGKDFANEELAEEKDKCDAMIMNPNTMPGETISQLHESLIGLHQNLSDVRREVGKILESKVKEIDKMVAENIDLKALQCLNAFKGTSALSTKSLDVAKTYPEKFEKAEKLLKKARMEGEKLCGTGQGSERIWKAYKKLYRLITIDRLDVNEFIGEKITPEELKLLKDRELIEFQEITHYEVKGFDACIENDDDE